MTDRFGRVAKLNVGDLEISNISDETGTLPQMAIGFDIELSTGRDPNKAKISIRNLSEDSRSKLSVDDPITASLSAGYVNDNVSELFQGDVRFSNIVNEGTDWITSFETGDGSKSYRKARINRSLKTAKPGDLLRACGEVLQGAGLKLGNLQSKINEGGTVSGLNEYLGGVVLSGLAVDVMSSVVTSLGYEWSIQGGQIQVFRPDEVIVVPTSDVLKVNKDSGLIGSPQLGKKGLIRFRMLLDGRAAPYQPIQVESLARPVGDLRIEKVRHIGDTWGNDWFSDIEAKETKKR